MDAIRIENLSKRYKDTTAVDQLCLTILKGRVTIILTTHYMEEAEALSDRIAIMKDGRLLICATAEEIKQKADTSSFEEAFIRFVKEDVQ